MPTTHGAGSPNQQLYSLFPKKKKGSKKNEELEEGEKRSSFGQRRGEGGMADKVLDWRAAPRLEPGPPQTREGGGAVSQPWERGIKKSKNKVRVGSGVTENREAGGSYMSFAEMAKRGSGGNAKEKSNRNLNKGGVEKTGMSRQTEPCLSQVVLNQISASTYGKIGKSADVSKYVMGGRGQEEEGITKQARVSELEVEFREEEEEENMNRREKAMEDFEVEFCSAAPGPRPRMSTVNKISANTFQQIGNSRNEGYVMQPSKSWSSVVGGSKKKSTTETKATSENAVLDNHPQGAPTEFDRIRFKLKEGKEELTETEREVLRVKRRERRKREKENKKKEKEEEKRSQMLAPQTSKLHMVTRATLEQMMSPAGEARVTGQIKTEKGIKFEDEEYPDLSSRPPGKKEKVISKEIRDEKGRVCQDRESNSEWETEEEKEGELDAEENEETLDAGCERISVVSDSGPLTYSSILKAKKAEPVPKARGVIIASDEMKKEMKSEKIEVKEEAAEKKKVRKKDPIEFDLFSALNMKKQKSQAQKKGGSGQGQVLGGKVKKDQAGPKLVRNQLDSSAPTKKRGKEREGGKKKKKTLLKKIILAERSRKKILREEAEKRRENRIKEGVFLKPLNVSDDQPEEFLDLVRRFDALKTEPTEESKDDPGAIEPEASNLEEETKREEQEVDDPEDKVEAKPSLEERAKASIHSRKFRPYCNQALSPDLDTLIGNLMADLTRFQDNQHAKDPVKAKARRRYAVGLREALKFVKVHKVSSLLLAPDLEAVEAPGGLDDTVGALIRESSKQGQEVPIIFGMNRRKLGRVCLRKCPVSCVAIMNPQGSDETYKSMLSLASELRQQYKDRVENEMEKISAEDSGINIKSTEAKSRTPLDFPGQPYGEAPVSRASSVLSLQAPEFVPSWERTGGIGQGTMALESYNVLHSTVGQYYEENIDVGNRDGHEDEAELQQQYQFQPVCYQPMSLPPWNRGHKW